MPVDEEDEEDFNDYGVDYYRDSDEEVDDDDGNDDEPTL